MCGGGHVWQRGHAWWVCVAGGMHGGMHGGGMCGGGMCGGGHAWWEGMHGGGHAWQGEGGMHGRKMAIAVGSMHPTGMHSCYNDSFSLIDFVQFCVDLICYRPSTKLREGNVFSHVCLYVCLSVQPWPLAPPCAWQMVVRTADLFKLDNLRPPIYFFNCWHLVVTKAGMVGKRAVHIILECFLVMLPYFWMFK